MIGVALAFRISTGLLFGFRLPVELEWFNPREWILNLGTAVSAAFYVFQNADLVSGAVQTTVLLSLGSVALIGMARDARRSALQVQSLRCWPSLDCHRRQATR